MFQSSQTFNLTFLFMDKKLYKKGKSVQLGINHVYNQNIIQNDQNNEFPPLYYAILNDSNEIERLIDSCSDLDLFTEFSIEGFTCNLVNIAARKGNAGALKKLLENGVSPNFIIDGRTAFNDFYDRAWNEEEIQRELLLKMDPDLIDHLGNTPLHYACEHFFSEEYIKLIKSILENSKHPDLKNLEGKTPFDLIMEQFKSAYRRALPNVIGLMAKEIRNTQLQVFDVPIPSQLEFLAEIPELFLKKGHNSFVNFFCKEKCANIEVKLSHVIFFWRFKHYLPHKRFVDLHNFIHDRWFFQSSGSLIYFPGHWHTLQEKKSFL